MCLLALFFRVVEDAPVILGANREEFYARGGEPPALHAGPRPIVAGIDPRAGGTWLGINDRGVIVAVTNRSKSHVPLEPRSRGLLARDMLNCDSAAQAVELATRELDSNRYAGCNFLCADRERAVAIMAGEWLRVRPLPPGLHGLTAHDVNDERDRRLEHALWWLSNRGHDTSSHCTMALKELCAQSGGPDPPICLHGVDRGTASSSIIVLRETLAQSQYWHAQGSPDRVPYADYSHLLRRLADSAAEGA